MHSTTGVTVRRSRLGSISSVALAALLIAGCSDGSSDTGAITGPDDDEQSAPEPEPEPDDEPDEPEEPEPDEPDDPFAVPDEIDEAYVEAVVNEILLQSSELTREVLADEPDPKATFNEAQSQQLFELFDGRQDGVRRSSLLDLVQSDGAREALLDRSELGRQRFEIEFLDSVDDGCITAVGWIDLTEFATEPFPRDEYAGVVLRRAEGDQVVNETGWHLLDAQSLRAGGDPVPLEDIRGSDLGQILDVECDG